MDRELLEVERRWLVDEIEAGHRNGKEYACHVAMAEGPTS